MSDLLWNSTALKSSERFSDDAIANAVKAALKSDPDLERENFDVSVENGVVTLRGNARDPELRQRAAAVAVSVPGVRSINNYIMTPGAPA